MSGDLFGDAVYEAWRRGLNPDTLDRDDFDDYADSSLIPSDAPSDYVDALVRKRQKASQQ